MSLRTKWSYATEILQNLNAQYINRDLKLDEREVLLKMDAMVNEMAKQGFIENWKLHMSGVDEQYITRWEWLDVTDPTNKAPSYFQIPAHYVALPGNNNAGIDQIYFENSFTVAKRKYFDPVIITTFKDVSTYRNTVAEYLEERISCYVKGGYIYFDRGLISARYGRVGIALVVKDSSAIGDNDPYPLPADIESKVINGLIEFYRLRLAQSQDLIRDADDITLRTR